MKLTKSDIRLIFQCVEYRNKLRAELAQLTNKSLAQKMGVHERTIDKIMSGEIHVKHAQEIARNG